MENTAKAVKDQTEVVLSPERVSTYAFLLNSFEGKDLEAILMAESIKNPVDHADHVKAAKAVNLKKVDLEKELKHGETELTELLETYNEAKQEILNDLNEVKRELNIKSVKTGKSDIYVVTAKSDKLLKYTAAFGNAANKEICGINKFARIIQSINSTNGYQNTNYPNFDNFMLKRGFTANKDYTVNIVEPGNPAYAKYKALRKTQRIIN